MSITFRSLGCACALAFFVVAIPVIAAETLTYTYDELGRLTVVERSGSVNNGAQSGYTFDAAGNRTGAAQQAGTTDPGTDPNAAISALCSLALPPAVKAQLGCP